MAANHVNFVNSVTKGRGFGELLRREPFTEFELSLVDFQSFDRSSRVEGGIPSLAAAPDGPETRPLVSASAASIISRSLRALPFKTADASARDVCKECFRKATIHLPKKRQRSSG